MGYAGKLDLKIRAIELRKKGYSYNQILKEIRVSKDSLNRWCSDIKLTRSQYAKITKRVTDGGNRGRLKGSKTMHLRRLEEIKTMKILGLKEVGRMTKRERFIAGVSLYLGEGNKNDQIVGFSNANPMIIKFIMDWFREFCEIPEERYIGQIWIHDDKNELQARRYWSKLTKINIQKFNKSYISKNIKSKKVRKNIHNFGVISIRVPMARVQRRILGWMDGILSN